MVGIGVGIVRRGRVLSAVGKVEVGVGVVVDIGADSEWVHTEPDNGDCLLSCWPVICYFLMMT